MWRDSKIGDREPARPGGGLEPVTPRPSAQDREFAFTARDFERVRELIHRRVGISLSASKQDMVFNRLVRRLRARRLRSFADYLALIEGGDPAELEAFTNALTTNLTSFYREAHHFPILASHLAERARTRRGPFSIWCCAASTGEEPYTIAMTALESLEGTGRRATILATDVDTSVLRKAEAATYDLERLAPVGADRMRRFWVRGGGERSGMATFRPELRELVSFRPLNLLDRQWAARGPFDAIFCRNVMIYFDKDTQRRILEKFWPLLAPDGLLFAGHSESFFNAADLFRLRGQTVYERLARSTAPGQKGAR